jgi:nucleotide-binding universal stress UspA family protein
MFTRILTAVDDVDADHRALQVTAELARSSGAAVRVLHIDATDVVGIGIVDLDDDDRSADDVMKRAIGVVASPGVQVEGRAVQALSGDVPDVIARSAEDFAADLVVLAPQHRGGLRALLFPRVSDAVAHVLEVPLLLVPAARRESSDAPMAPAPGVVAAPRPAAAPPA